MKFRMTFYDKMRLTYRQENSQYLAPIRHLVFHQMTHSLPSLLALLFKIQAKLPQNEKEGKNRFIMFAT